MWGNIQGTSVPQIASKLSHLEGDDHYEHPIRQGFALK